MTPWITVEELSGLDGPLVLDATVDLPTAERERRGEPARSGIVRFRRGHIPGARHIDLLGDLSRADATYRFAVPPAPDLAARLAERGVDGRHAVVVYDDDRSYWAARCWWMLRSLGWDDVRVLDGGLGAWRRAGLPVETGPPPPVSSRTPAPVVPPATPAFVGRSSVEALIRGDVDATLVCALPSSVFTGRAAGRYARSGHIPGARNVPAEELLDDEGRLLHRDERHRIVRDGLREADRPVVVYCGGGISACLVAMVLTEMGHARVSVYDGSLEEWAADPSLPLVSEAG